MNSNMTIIDIHQAIQQISKGEIVVLPFEDHFIICGLAKNEHTVRNILENQKKKSTQPLEILFPSLKSISLHQIESPLLKLAQPIWPAPLSVIVPAFPGLPSSASGLTQMVAIQVPSHPLLSHILDEVQEPLLYIKAMIDHHEPVKHTQECLSGAFKNLSGVVNGGLSKQGCTVIAYQFGGYQIQTQGQITKAEIDHFELCDDRFVS